MGNTAEEIRRLAESTDPADRAKYAALEAVIGPHVRAIPRFSLHKRAIPRFSVRKGALPMPSITAEQFRQRTIQVPIPAPAGAPPDAPVQYFTCRRPDPLVLIADGVLPLEVYGHVLAQIADRVDAVFDNRPPAGGAATRREYSDFIDRWVCAAAVEPRIVLTEAEATAAPEALWAEEVDADLKLAIFRMTNARILSPRMTDAVSEFLRRKSPGAPAGSDGAAVRDAAVEPAAGV